MPVMHQRAGTGLQLALELSKHRPVKFQEFWWLCIGTAILFIYFTMCLELDHSVAVPAFLYGAAHQSGRPLDDIRRALGYFQHNNGGLWIGSNIFPASMQPDCGPRVAPPGSGIVVVGACPWVMNYNVPLTSIDLSKGKRIAKKVSARGGGLAKVQAMALLHGTDCIEIACNLLDTEVSSPDALQRLRRRKGLKPLKDILQVIQKRISSD